jgi:AraC-like DNA-binding protein
MALHSSFGTELPAAAEEFLSVAYTDIDLRLPEDGKKFHFADDRIDPGPFKLDEMTIGATAAFGYETTEEFFITRVISGTLRLLQPGDGIDETFGHGDIGMLSRPGIDSVTEVDPSFSQDVITLTAPYVREAAGLDPDGGELPTFTSVRPATPQRARTWRQALELIGGMLHGDPAVADAPLVVGSANRMLAGLMLATFPNTATPRPVPLHGRDARNGAALRRAISFIDSNADRDIGIAEIAGAANVSRRAVQLAFRRHLGTTPTGYLRRVRLDCAHRELLGAVPEDHLTVTDVAYRWGFSSPSRFAERYRAAFGTPPSETLRE